MSQPYTVQRFKVSKCIKFPAGEDVRDIDISAVIERTQTRRAIGGPSPSPLPKPMAMPRHGAQERPPGAKSAIPPHSQAKSIRLTRTCRPVASYYITTLRCRSCLILPERYLPSRLEAIIMRRGFALRVGVFAEVAFSATLSSGCALGISPTRHDIPAKSPWSVTVSSRSFAKTCLCQFAPDKMSRRKLGILARSP